jgi:hypothetical protein
MRPIASKRPLSIDQIAEQWGNELPDTSKTELQDLLMSAVFFKELATAESPERLLEEMNLPAPEQPLPAFMRAAMTQVTRDEFFRWIDEKGYQRPTFWDSAKSLEKELPRATQNHRLPRPARERARVKGLMRADIEAGKVTIEELCRDKIAWAAKYNTGPTTARDAARKLAAELKRKE